jgi:MFS family permease
MSRSVDHAYASPQISDADSVLASGSLQPTNVRHRIIALSICMSLILYLDRNALGSVTSSIVSDLKITNGDFGIGTKWFFWLYALFQVPAGMLADRFGARRMLTIYVIAWSLATIGLGFVPGLFGLIGLRAVMGAAQAGAYPAAGSFLKRWANPTARAKANSFVSAGGRFCVDRADFDSVQGVSRSGAGLARHARALWCAGDCLGGILLVVFSRYARGAPRLQCGRTNHHWP